MPDLASAILGLRGWTALAVVFLLPAPSVSDPAYWSFRLFAEALGGGMSSRLFQEARERLGLAYAIAGSLLYRWIEYRARVRGEFHE